MNTTEIILMSAAIYFLCCRENNASMGKIKNYNLAPGPIRYNIYRQGYAGAAGLGQRYPSEGYPQRNTPFFRNSPKRFPGVAGYLPQGSSPTAEMAHRKQPAYYWETRVEPTRYNGYGRSVYPKYHSISRLKI